MVRYTAIRSLLALDNHIGLEIRQIDVKAALLQGTLDAEMYMKQQRGYNDEA